MPTYHRVPRINELMALDERIRVALLGESDRWDLIELRRKVRREIQNEIEANGGSQFIEVS